MNRLSRFKAWLINLSTPDSKTLATLGEDIRKFGITSIGIGLVGLTVAGDTITTGEALVILAIGVCTWLYGVYLTHLANS